MAQSYKICPICNTPNHRNATLCSTCGAALARVQPVSSDADAKPASRMDYNPDYGETDLLEGGLRWKGGTYLLGGLLAFLLLICGGGFVLLAGRVLGTLGDTAGGSTMNTVTPIQTIAQGGIAAHTNTPFSTIFLPTVTPAPPTDLPTDTPAPTPTQGPCVEIVQPNDDLISIIYRCGHRTLDILDTVVELNDLNDSASIQLGQEIQVPWPTVTPDPNAIPSSEVTDESGVVISPAAAEIASGSGEVMGVRLVPTATLQPGVSWHIVQPNENILIIASQYGATLRILSDLNPEVTFSQCDFGSGSGGPNCVVQLSIGQQLRVPAPTPTPTIQPTASGSETPTPTATPTFNAPSVISPGDRAFFGKDELVTLRWVATGSLKSEQAYLVSVEDLTAGQVYTATTQELSFIMPEEWHSQTDARHDYRWSVSVIDIGNPGEPYFATEKRLFTWQGRGG